METPAAASAAGKRKRVTVQNDEDDSVLAKRVSSGSSQDSMVVMLLHEHAALSRPSRERSLLMYETFVNPLMEFLTNTDKMPPLAIPFVPWMLVGSQDNKLLYRPIASYMSGCSNAVIRMFTFAALGTGRVQLMEQKFLALLSVFIWGANKCSAKPFFGAFCSKLNKLQENMYSLPKPIARHVWDRQDVVPYQTDVYDLYNLKKKPTIMSLQVCMSKMHSGGRSVVTTPLAMFAHSVPMCASCFLANCNGVSPNMTALLKCKTPWRATDAMTNIKDQHKPVLHRILSTLKRAHIVAAFDTEAAAELFLDARSNEEHGMLVEQLPYCFPHVYAVRENAFAAINRRPMTAFGWNMLFGHKLSATCQSVLETYSREIEFKADEFVNHGRAPLPDTLPVLSDDLINMLPIITFNNAIETGLFPHQLFVFDAEDCVIYSTAFMRVIHAIATGYLKLNLVLTPPLQAEKLQPKITKLKTVRVAPSVKWTPNAAEQAYIQVGNKKSVFYDAEAVTYEWLANILNVYEQAADAKRVPTPKQIELTLCGSYYNAASKITLLDREGNSSYKNIVAGGCFTELIHIALDEKLANCLLQTHSQLRCTTLFATRWRTTCRAKAENQLSDTLTNDELFWHCQNRACNFKHKRSFHVGKLDGFLR